MRCINYLLQGSITVVDDAISHSAVAERYRISPTGERTQQ